MKKITRTQKVKNFLRKSPNYMLISSKRKELDNYTLSELGFLLKDYEIIQEIKRRKQYYINAEIKQKYLTSIKIPEIPKKKSNKYKNLMKYITQDSNLLNAFYKAAKGNKNSKSYFKFNKNRDINLTILKNELLEKTYKRGDYYTFIVLDPKVRVINSLSFRDRVVQHAINNIIEPIFERTFYIHSYACRKNKGTHKCAKETQAAIRRINKRYGTCKVLKMDFSKYFSSINSDILINEIRKRIKDEELMNILLQYINNIGINIGNLLSQLFANIYGNIFDLYIKHELKIKYYFRYMDDTVILSNDVNILYNIKEKLDKFIKTKMNLKFSHWYIHDVEEKSVNFVGYRIRNKYKLIRKQTSLRFKRKLIKFNHILKENLNELKDLLFDYREIYNIPYHFKYKIFKILQENFNSFEMILGAYKGISLLADNQKVKINLKGEYTKWKKMQLT